MEDGMYPTKVTDNAGGKCKTSRPLGKGCSGNEIEWNKARFKRSSFSVTPINHYARYEKIKWYSKHVEAFNMCLIEYVAII
jgi:hypothetical protein